MNFSDLGFKITVAYEDLSDVWPVISKAIEARLPLHQVTLINKLGTSVTVDHMSVELVSSFEPAVQKLQQYAYSALTWFRQPAASLVLISCNDADDYKKNFRLQLRAMIDSEGRHPLSPEPVFVYIAPPPSPELDPKAAGRVVDAMKRELGSRRRERVARVDLVPATPTATTAAVASPKESSSIDLGLQGIDEVIICLKAAIAASLEARIGAYGEVVRQHLTALQASRPDVCFSDLFLLKDSLAVMMEAAGLVEDSVREYLELEVAFQQVEQTKKQNHLSPQLSQAPQQAMALGKSNINDGGTLEFRNQQQISVSPLGGSRPDVDLKQLEFLNGGLQPRVGIDEAAGIWSSWRASRLAVQGIVLSPDGTLESSSGYGTSVPTAQTVTSGDTTSLLALRQAVFASQARVLLKLHRYAEVLNRGLSFFHSSFSILAAHEDDEEVKNSVSFIGKSTPKLFKESWTFAGCVTLAAAVAASSSSSQQHQRQHQEGSTSSQYYLKGVFEEGEEKNLTETNVESTFEAFDWRLGLPISNYQETLFNNNSGGEFATASSSASTRSMYCLLGQFYCTARAQLETLGAAHGLHPPEFSGDVAASAAAVAGAASSGVGLTTPGALVSSPGAGGYNEDSLSTSPRRTLQKVRSMSPSRVSLDLGSVRSSFLSATAGGGGSHLGGVESGDEASSLSVRIHNHQDLPSDTVQENMQTIDLAAGNNGGEGAKGANGKPGTSIDNDNNEAGSGSGTLSGETAANGASIEVASSSSSSQQNQILGPMAAAAAMNTNTHQSDQSRAITPNDMTAAQISADAAEKGVELMPVASVMTLPPAPPSPQFSSSSLPAAGAVSQSHHRRTNTSTSMKIGETDSGVSTPRSASAASSVAGAAAAVGGVTTTAATGTSTTSSQDAGVAMRKIERILDDLWAPILDNKKIDSNGSAGSNICHRPSSSAAAEDDSGVWKPVHWRLCRALASQTAFSDLWQALTVAAALCFENGNRSRQAVQCRAEIADCLASKGQFADAARLYEAQCRIALAEGWTLAAAAHLPKLAACQAALQSPGLPHTAAALLKLASSTASTDSIFSASDAAAAVTLLCNAAALPRAALPLPPPLLPPRQTAPGPGAAGTLPFIITDTGMVDLSSILAAQPLKGNYSKFYCRNDIATGRPILCPTAAPSTATASTAVSSAITATISHVQCAVGDVNVITLKVTSRLPTSLALQDVKLLLLGMQELTALASPRATSPSYSTAFRPSMQNMPLSSWNSSQHGNFSVPQYNQVLTPSSAMTATTGRGGGGIGGSSGAQQSPFYRADSFADEGPRFTTEWQDTEDLLCSLVSIAYEGRQLHDKEKEVQGKETIKKTNGGSGSGTALLSPVVGPVELQPGVNILRFMAAPVKRGLYRPLRITAMLHNLEITLDVEESSSLSTSFLNSDSSSSISSSSTTGVVDQGHVFASFENSAAYSIVLEVEPTVPRISVAALSSTGGSDSSNNSTGSGCLIAGQKQWIGLHVIPGRDVLEDATLAITWPVPPTEISRKMSGMLTSSTSTGAGDVAGGGAIGSLSPELSFNAVADGSGGAGGFGMSVALLPQHNAALVSMPNFSSPSSSSAAADKNFSVVSASSSWVHQDGHQEIPLPATPSLVLNRKEYKESIGGGVTVWWWIEAGSFLSPSEQVKVIAPGQQVQDGGSSGGAALGVTDNAKAASSQHMLLYLPLYLQYLSGCRRTFSKVVPLSVHHPFAVNTSARELSNVSIVTHFTVSSLLPHTVTVTSASLALQPGLHLVRDVATELGIFPLVILPHSVFSLSFIVTVDRTMAAGDRAAAQARLQQAAKMQPTALQVSYTVGIEESCGGAVMIGSGEEESVGVGVGGGGGGGRSGGAFAGHRTTVHGDTTVTATIGKATGVSQQQASSNIIHLPSAAALFEFEKNAIAAAAGGSASTSSSSPFTSIQQQEKHQQQQLKNQQQQEEYQECNFIHHCALELSPLESDIPGAVVLVQLLGPFSATAGHPVSLCWRLERAGAAVQGITTENNASQNTSSSAAAAVASEPLKIQFEIGAQGGETSWRPLGRRSGAVVLEPYDGAIATIEATWIPLVAGTVAAPSLRLADVAYQECFEVGSGSTNYLVVMPSPY